MMQTFEGRSWEFSLGSHAGAGEGRQYLLTVHPQPLGARAVSNPWHEQQLFFTHSYVLNLHMPVRCYL